MPNVAVSVASSDNWASPVCSTFNADTPKTEKKMIVTSVGARSTPATNCLIVRPLDTRAINIPTNGDQEIHQRSEEHTSELQSRFDLVCRLLLEKKNTPRCPIPQPNYAHT